MRLYGAGASQASKGIGLTATEASIDRLNRSTDVALWVELRLRDLDDNSYRAAFFRYACDMPNESIAHALALSNEQIGELMLATRKHLNSCIRAAMRAAGVEEVA